MGCLHWRSPTSSGCEYTSADLLITGQISAGKILPQQDTKTCIHTANQMQFLFNLQRWIYIKARKKSAKKIQVYLLGIKQQSKLSLLMRVIKDYILFLSVTLQTARYPYTGDLSQLKIPPVSSSRLKNSRGNCFWWLPCKAQTRMLPLVIMFSDECAERGKWFSVSNSGIAGERLSGTIWLLELFEPSLQPWDWKCSGKLC